MHFSLFSLGVLLLHRSLMLVMCQQEDLCLDQVTTEV